jgi:hypothetical protein
MRNTARTLRKDLSILSSVALLGLVGACALTGLGMDEAPEIMPLDDVHPLIGFAMAAVAALHALLNLGPMLRYTAKRLRGIAQLDRNPTSSVR